MSTIGNYVLHVYCDHPDHTSYFVVPGKQVSEPWPMEYHGQNEGECMESARKDGCVFRAYPGSKFGGLDALCPYHAKVCS